MRKGLVSDASRAFLDSLDGLVPRRVHSDSPSTPLPRRTRLPSFSPDHTGSTSSPRLHNTSGHRSCTFTTSSTTTKFD